MSKSNAGKKRMISAMDNLTEKHNSIVEGVIWKQLLLFFFPILLGTFFQQLYNTVDAAVVGKFVGKEALAAVGGATGTLINLFVGFFVGLSSGATVIISQFYGARKEKPTEDSVHTAVAMGIAGGLLLTVIGMLLAPTMLKMMDTPDDVLEPAVTYLRIYFAGMVFNLLYNIGSSILRAIGDSRRPLYILIVCTLTNLVLDLAFVLLFHMGVAGAGLATILSQAISALLVLYFLSRSNECYKLTVRKIRFHSDILRHIIKIGLPAGIQSSMFCISNIIIQSTINTFGTDTMAAWTAYGKIDSVFWMLMSAFGISITTFSGQNFGCGKLDRVKKSVRISLAMALGSSMLLSAILLLLGQYIFLLFTDDGNVLELGVHILRTLVPFYATYVLVEVLSGAIRGTGESLRPMLISGFGICVLRIVWITCFLGADSHLNMVLYSYPISWAFTSLLFLIYYLRGNWLKKRIYETSLSL